MNRSAAAAGAALLLLAACTAERSPDGGPSSTASSTPGSRAPGTASPPGSRPPEPPQAPTLVLAQNPRNPPLDIPLPTARALVAGERDRFAGLEVRRGRRGLRAAAARPDVLAVAPVDLVTARVEVATVGGSDPLRRPRAYPLRSGGPLPRVTTVTVVGDIMLARRVAAAAGELPGRQLLPTARRLAAADITVGNLESTLSTAGPPTQGEDSFAADPSVRARLRTAGFDALSLANNHAGDFGPVALTETVRLLGAGRVTPFGAGGTPRRAWRPAVVERGGLRFGFLGFNAIGETPEVGRGRPGAVSVSMPPRTGPLDRVELRRFLSAVRGLDRQVDVVTVLPHWGTQYTNRPEPVQHEVARALVQAGADVVVGGHPHWVQGAGMVGEALVVHSLGNFVFDMDFMAQTQLGLVLELVFWDGRLKGAAFVPYRIGPDFAPRLVPHSDASVTLDLFWEFSSLGASPR